MISRTEQISTGLRALVEASGENSRDHGFHEDWPLTPAPFCSDKEASDYDVQLRRAIAEKLALVHEEVSEALGEIRSGRDPLEVYYVDHKGLIGEKGREYESQVYDGMGTIAGVEGAPLLKPEGFPVEVADAIIRLADLIYLVNDQTGDQLAQATEVKALYNSTRPYKHGRKF